MAPLQLDENNATYQIRAYKPGSIQINEKIFHTSIIVAPHQLIENWTPCSTNEITSDTLQIINELKPDILLIGTGSEHVFLPVEIYGELINTGIGVEVMNTSAACRTFNALCAEGRRVVAALII